MKQFHKKILGLLLLASAAQTLNASSPRSTDLVPTLGPVTPYIAIRSQGYDLADELSGWTQHINLFDMDKVYGSFSIKPKYTRTFKSSQLCSCLFGVNDCNNNCGCSLNVSGSRVADRGSTDLLADYFYLPTDYQSTLNFNPRIENALVDFNFYVGLDEWMNGLFFRVHLPLCWTRWNLNFVETITNPGTASTGGTGAANLLDRTTVGGGYAPGYFAYSTIQTQNLLKNFTSYAAGCSPANFIDPNNSDTVTTFNPLNFARISPCAQSKTAIADLAFILGYNIVNDCDYHLGLGLFASAPTGTRPQALYLFEPIVGNGKSWAFGLHYTSHAMLWRSEDEESGIGLYFDCNVTHLFNADQRRTFDLRNKSLSRYMLTEQMGTPVTNLFAGPSIPPTAPNAVFQNVYTPLANLTTRDVQVSVAVQGDLILQLTYTNGCMALDVGYNYWGRSCETITFDCNPKCNSTCNLSGLTSTVNAFAENNYALKGDASVYAQAIIPPAVTAIPVALSATQSTDGFADITGGSNYYGDPELINVTGPGDQNPQIDNKQLAYADAAATIPLSVVADAALTINTSNPAAFIKGVEINNKQGTRGSSNKIYGNLSYQWLDCEDWVPFIGIGGFAEFGNIDGVNSSQCVTAQTDCSGNCTTCPKCSISQWGVWSKFGVSFN